MSKTKNTWHSISSDEVISGLETSKSGLSLSEVKKRQQEFGPNRLDEKKSAGPLIRFLAQFHNLLIYVLIVAAIITTLMQHYIDSIVIMGVVFVNAIIGFVQEGKAKKALEAIKNMLSPSAIVIREGERDTIESTELVPGDIVILEAGDKVPADLRIIEAKGLQTQEAALTGESVPIEKNIEKVPTDSSIGDQTNMCFSGTLVTSGHAKGVVTSIGKDTQIGQISTMISNIEAMTTPLLKAMHTFSKWLTVAIIFLSSLVFIFAYILREFGITESFMAAVALSVAAIPEGLPAILTITLAIGVQRMASQKAIIRKLPAVETLGSVSTICSDKTGTLTRNEMMVQTITTPKKSFQVSGEGLSSKGEFHLDDEVIEPSEYKDLQLLIKSSILCSDAQVKIIEEQVKVSGDPMEGALIIAGHKADLYANKLNQEYTRLDHIPFTSENRYMATLNQFEDGTKILIKGAPEKVLEICQLNAEDNKFWYEQIEKMTSSGERVLAVAIIEANKDKKELNEKDLDTKAEILGLLGLIDPPRSEAISAVKECQRAGINVKMITGDHAGTAKAIGIQLNLSNTESVLTGKEIDQMSDSELREYVLKIDIFARTSPEHKLRLVQALQSHNKIVAMTGDGVNDAPALKQADVGVAMGHKGTESAKEASEMVLADDNFASIARAVKEGRNVYDNLKKAITFLLPINGGESGSIMMAIMLGLALPMTPLQVLWVNMVSSVTLAMALAFEPAESNIMTRPPRDANASIISGFLVWRIIFVSFLFLIGIFGVFTWSIQQGHSIEYARTHAVNVLVVMEVFYLLSVRKIEPPQLKIRDFIGTNAVITVGFIVIGLQLIFNYVPFMNTIFDSRPMGVEAGVLVMMCGILLFIILNIEKLIMRKMGKI